MREFIAFGVTLLNPGRCISEATHDLSYADGVPLSITSIRCLRSANKDAVGELSRFLGLALFGVGGFNKTGSRFRSLRNGDRSA